MKYVILVCLVVAGLLVPAYAEAQGLGYGVAGPAGYGGWFGAGATWHVAGGGEALFAKGIAGGAAEIGFFSYTQVMSFNGVAHLADAGDRTSPFVTGGYSRFSSGEGTFHAFNIGGGADFWANNHAGVRVELRDHVRRDFRGTVHYVSIRAGVAFK